MSNGQQPNSEDEPGPAWTPGDIHRATGKSDRLEPTPALRRFTEQFLTLTEQFERDRRTEILATGGDPDEDRDPFEHVRWIAEGYDENRNNPKELAKHLDRVGDQLDLADARALRIAAEVVKKATPQLIRTAAEEDGMTPAQIADELGLTESYVYRLLREHRENYDPQ